MADANEGRKPVIAANWKMHHDHLVAIQTVQKLSYRLDPEDYDACEVVVCPPFTDLRTLQTLIDSDRLEIRLGAQNCFWEDAGAYTGEVSPVFLAKLNVQYVIVGHSERRQLFGESDEACEQEGEGRAEARDGPDRLCRRDARGARGRCHRRQGVRAGSRRVPRHPGGDGRAVCGRVRAHLGDRHRAERDTRRRERHHRGGAAPRSRSSTTPRSRRRSGSSTAAASSPATPPSSWPSRRSTGRSWVAHHSIPTTSPRIVQWGRA